MKNHALFSAQAYISVHVHKDGNSLKPTQLMTMRTSRDLENRIHKKRKVNRHGP